MYSNLSRHADLIPRVYKRKAKLVEQAVVPVVWQLACSTGDVDPYERMERVAPAGIGAQNPQALQRAALMKLCKSLAHQMGTEELASAMQQQQTLAASKRGASGNAALINVPNLVRQLVNI